MYLKTTYFMEMLGQLSSIIVARIIYQRTTLFIGIAKALTNQLNISLEVVKRVTWIVHKVIQIHITFISWMMLRILLLEEDGIVIMTKLLFFTTISTGA